MVRRCGRDRRRRRGLQQDDFRSVRTGHPADVVGIGHKERVARRGRKFADHAHESERDDVILMVAGVLQAQVDLVSGLQLEILDRFGGNQNAVRSPRQQVEGFLRVAALEIGIRHPRRLADMRRIDAVQVLQIRADIGQPMLHRLRGAHSRQRREFAQLDPRGRLRRAGDGDVRAIGEFGVDLRLRVVSGIEDGGRTAKAKASATKATPCVIRLGCRPIVAATTPASTPAIGRRPLARVGAPALQSSQTQPDRQQADAEPQQHGGEKGGVVDGCDGVPSGASTT